jgi:hypothetical protein
MRRIGTYLPLVLCVVPYMGYFGWYNNMVAAITIALVCSLVLIGGVREISLRAAGFVVFSILVSALISIEQGKPVNYLSFTDFAFVLIWLSLTNLLVRVEQDEVFAGCIVFLLTAIGFVNLLACILLRAGIFDSSIFYGETASYDQSYSSIRSIGIIGQPGKMGLFSAFSVFSLAVGHSISRLKLIKRLAIIGVVLFLMSAFLSFSRTGIILSLTALLAFQSKLPQFIIMVVCIVGAIAADDEMVSLLLRGSDSEVLNISSLNNRNVLREKAFETVLGDPVSFAFGFGPSKEAADMIPLPIIGHSLRYPDSSLTLIVFRYGLLGVVAAAYTFYSVLKSFGIKFFVFRKKIGFVFCVMCGVSLCLDPVWHDPKVLIIFLFGLRLLSKLKGHHLGLSTRV